MHPLVRGALAGATASAPMTAAMLAMHAWLPVEERYELPPEQLTARLARRAGLDGVAADRRMRLPATAAAHHGYGALAGALYGAVRPALPASPVLSGTVWGLAVWAGSYLGWLPALGLRRPPTEHPPEREALMVAAHLVYGLATAALDDALRRPPDGREAPRRRSGPSDRSSVPCRPSGDADASPSTTSWNGSAASRRG